jgi:hypothetical protein
MRREHHDTRAGKRSPSSPDQHKAPAEDRTRAYERNVLGEARNRDPLTLDDGAASDAGDEIAGSASDRTITGAVREGPAPSERELDRQVDQELAWASGSPPARYGSLRKEDTDLPHREPPGSSTSH